MRNENQDDCFSATRGLCNSCGVLTDAKVVFHEGKVFLVKWCPEHGESRAMISSDVDWYLDSISYIKPGTKPVSHAVDSYASCPESCGLCPQHQQHTCLPILEITDRCDLKCPICLVDCPGVANDLSPNQASDIIDELLKYEGELNLLNISGGEPTAHPNFLEVVDKVIRPEIGMISVSTNGLKLADDDDLLKALIERNVVISLQFDGFSPETSETLRGKGSLVEIKTRLIEKIRTFGGKLSLTVTLAKGVNEGELKKILDLFFSNDHILSVMVQPMAHAGRAWREYDKADYLDILTIPDVVKLLTEGSGGILEEEDFTPLPCSHPSCFALTYLLKTAAGSFVPLPRLFDKNRYLDVIKNQALFNADWDSMSKIKDALYDLWSSDGIIPEKDGVLKTIREVLLEMNRIGETDPHNRLIDLGAKNVKSIFIHHFMDRATFDLSRAIKCCNHYPQIDGRLMPACIRNNLQQ